MNKYCGKKPTNPTKMNQPQNKNTYWHSFVTDDQRTKLLSKQQHPSQRNKQNSLRTRRAINAVFEDLHGYPLQRSPHFPVEYRTYPAQSAGMQRHSDLPMFDPPQTELVYTVRNDDAQTRFRWWDVHGKRHEVAPRPNDLVMVRASGPLHDVTPLGDGTRSIVKFVAHAPTATPRATVLETQRQHCPTK